MFKKARTTLTIYYVGVIALGMIIFSSVFYLYSVQDIRHDVGRDTNISVQARAEVVSRTLGRLEEVIVVGDSIVLFVLAFLAYLLAGWTLEPIQRALDAQERFSANASHELRTPLAVMRMESEVFLQEDSPSIEEARELIRSNLEEIGSMTSIVESLLVLARNRSAKHTITGESFDLTELALQVARKVEMLYKGREVALEISIGAPLWVFGERKLMGQAISNILQNAFGYTDKGSVSLVVSREGSNAIMSVADTGIGISSEDQGKLTEPFFRIDRIRSGAPNGFGLGLSIVQEIVILHGGNLFIDSCEGQGTTVRISLPSSIKSNPS